LVLLCQGKSEEGKVKTFLMKNKIHILLTWFIASVWLINGLFCKVLNWGPRHEEIVARILSKEYSRLLIVLIGISEILMAIWVLSKYKSRINAILQIVIVLSMNILELLLTPEILLWGSMNTVFALLFIGLVYYNEFVLKEKV